MLWRGGGGGGGGGSKKTKVVAHSFQAVVMHIQILDAPSVWDYF
jgi:hypothetical protein